MEDEPPKRLHDLFLAPIWVLASQGGGFKSPHRADQPQRNFCPTLE
jgi:hypothetical protein